MAATFTDEEVFGGGKTFSEEEVFRGTPMPDALDRSVKADQSLWGKTKAVARDVGGNILGGAAAAGDMILGIPGQALGIGANIGARTRATIGGESPQTAATAGQLAQHEIAPEWMTSPLKTMMKIAGMGGVYNDQEIVTQSLDTAANAISKKTGGLLLKEDVADLFNVAMLGVGARATDLGVKQAFTPKVARGGENRAVYDAEAAIQQSRLRIQDKSKAPLEGEVLPPEPRLAAPQPARGRTLDMERGAADPELLKYLAAGSAGAIAAYGVISGGHGEELGMAAAGAAGITGGKRLVKLDPALDAARVERAKAGDQAAFTELFQTNISRLERSVMPLMKDADAAKDVAQMAMASAFKNIGSFRGDSSFNTWVHRIAQNIGKNELKAISRRPQTEELTGEIAERVGEDAQARGGQDFLEASQTHDAVRAGMEKLPEDFRTAVEMRDLEGMTYEEMAVKLNVPIGTVRSRIARGREALKEYVTRAGVGKVAAAGGAVGLATHMNDEELRNALLGGAAIMAVKPKGGMWHPEAVERLARPLTDKLMNTTNNIGTPIPTSTLEAGGAWSKKAVTNYLNKHAGTEGDPLAKVEIPRLGHQREGANTISGGEAMDQVITSNPARAYRDGNRAHAIDPAIKNAPADEPVYMAQDRGPHADTITSYLSHVGDYLRQNVSPEKLAQYDLVRAVQETAKNDARVAKEMEKAQAASTASLPVHKAYHDGFKWVELKLPEKLTEEQGRGVRLAKQGERQGLRGQRAADEVPEYVALDGKGEPIKNSYTSGNAIGKTPEEAWLAGRLAEEGNALGHCVGGYCETVASGESKIYSLRDAKGGSHVTVEVAPPDIRTEANTPVAFYKQAPKEVQERIGYEPTQGTLDTVGDWTRRHREWRQDIIKDAAFKEWIADKQHDILQIKGKQNRAPSPDYLPYVQDFVKSGKWGEVGDLSNAGLVRLKEDNLGSKSIKDALGGREYVTAEEYGDALAKQAGLKPYSDPQRGSADPRLLAAIAAAGGLAAYLAVNPEETEKLTALGLIGATKGKVGRVFEKLGEVVNLADVALGRSTTRIANIAPPLARAVRDMEHAAAVTKTQASGKIEAFTKAAATLPKDKQAALERAYLDNDPHKIAEAIKGNAPLVTAYRNLRQWLDETGATLEGFDRFKRGITEYLPRVVKDFEGLMEAMGKTAKGGLENLLLEAERKSLKERGRPLSEVERSVILNNFMMKDPNFSHQPSYAKKRVVRMRDELAPFYYGMEDSLIRYAHAAMEDIATTKFFGKDVKHSTAKGAKFTNVEDSIGAVTDRLLESKEITPKQAVELQKILRARFGAGEQSPHWALQDARNVTGVATLGQFGSGVVQLTETALAAYHHGAVPAIKAVGIILTGKGIQPKEFGLANHVIEEVIGARPTGAVLSGVLKANMLSLFDQFGMKENLTASFLKNKALVSTPKGVAALKEKWGPTYGADFPALVRELQTSSVNARQPLVESLLWGELSDIRPTSRSEAPQAFNAHPNLRMFYQLKQFMLTQADIVRRDAYNKIKTGDPKEVARGVKNLALFATALSLAYIPVTAVKDWISGREFDFDKTDYVANFAQNFGLSRYVMDKISESATPGKAVVEAGMNMVTPPAVSVAQRIGEGISNPKKLATMIPLIGRPYYDRELGGNEQIELNDARRKRRKDRDEREEADPYLKERRLERAEQRREKALDRARMGY